MNKKIKWMIISMLLVFWLGMICSYANNELDVYINKNKYHVTPAQVMLDGEIIPMSVPSYIIESRIVVPVRFLAEHVGAVVKWDQIQRRVIITTLKKEIQLWIDKPSMKVNGVDIDLDKGSIPQITQFPNGEMRTMVPLRAISELLGYEVDFDSETTTGTLKKKPEVNNNGTKLNPTVSGSTITKADVIISNGKLVLNLAGIQNKNVKILRLEQPNRLVFDIEDTVFAPGKWEYIPINYENIDKIRVAQFQSNDTEQKPTTRVVFDVNKIDSAGELRYFFEENSMKIDIRAIEKMINSNEDKVSDKEPKIKAPEKKEPVIVAPNNDVIITEPANNSDSSIQPEWQDMINARIANAKLLPLPDVSANYEANKLIHILIDPGHGGQDPGTISYSNKKEKDFALPASLKLRDELQKLGYTVHMTRETDRYPTLYQRANMANELKVDIFISMHANSIENKSSVNGIEVWYSGGNKIADYSSLEKKLARSVLNKMIMSTGAINRGVKVARHVVTIKSKMAAILIESGFITNPVEEALLYNDNYQNILVRSIAVGVNDFVNNYRKLLANSKNIMINNQPIIPVIPEENKRVRYKVNADALNVRQSPGLDAPSVGKVYQDEVLTVEYGVEEISKDGYTWLYTTDNSGNLSGWLAKEFLIEQK